ncbi:hypothetical protein OBBRIDRAFT_836748 [Obba rivulosa]|uniref:HMG box domain-containing protein n=1 Tax=Obba rivulosa TaxID=1052685 RepID=A0A8E2DMN1_9APHY|nr:hypothetical protein OBBRIDRAFT_836748 [Obba rivulosa]
MSSSSSPVDVCGWTAPDDYSALNMSYASLPSYHSHDFAPPPSTLFTMPSHVETLSRPRTASLPPAGVALTKKQRREEAGYIPRPANAFIIFRAEFSRKNAQGAQPNGAAQRPHETLSRRAGDAWKKLTPAEKHPYKVLAQKEAKAHAEANPNYVYRPQRKGCTRRGTVTPSRREQVEHHMREAGVPQTDSESDRSANMGRQNSPGSLASSPEPPEMYALHGSSRASRASSVAPPFQPQPQMGHCPSLSQLEFLPYFASPSFASSSPAIRDIHPDYAVRRPRSFTDGASPITPDALFASQAERSDEDGYLSYGTFRCSSSSSPSEVSFSSLSINEHGVSQQPSELTTIPTSSAGFTSYTNSPVYAQPVSPLFQRRRAATTSVVPLSPISIFPSADGTWSPDSAPSLSESSSSPDTYFGHEFFGNNEGWAEPNAHSQQHIQTQSSSQGLGPEVGLDFDTTPRCSQFPQHVQGTAPIQNHSAISPPVSESFYAHSYDAADFQGYAQGLHDFGIEPSNFQSAPFEGMPMGAEVDNVMPMEYNDVFYAFAASQ